MIAMLKGEIIATVKSYDYGGGGHQSFFRRLGTVASIMIIFSRQIIIYLAVSFNLGSSLPKS